MPFLAIVLAAWTKGIAVKAEAVFTMAMDATLERLIKIAKERGISQKQLCEMARLSPNRLSRIKESVRLVAPRFDEVVAMARVLGVSLDELAFGVPGDPAEARVREIVAEIGADEAWRRLIRAEPRRLVPMDGLSEEAKGGGETGPARKGGGQ